MDNASKHPQVVQIYKTIKAQTLLDSFEVANIFNTEFENTYFVEVIADEEVMNYVVNPINQKVKLQ